MLKRLLIGFAALAVASAVFGEAYKWVDDDGVVHYSDRPAPGAVEIQLPTYRASSRPVTRSAPGRRRQSTATQPAEPNKPFTYESLTIAAPAAEETQWNIEGVLNVTLDLRPALQRGHRVRAYFDGTPQMVSGTSFQLSDVFRGVHNLQVEVLDETGQMMIRSATNRFYIQQNAIGR